MLRSSATPKRSASSMARSHSAVTIPTPFQQTLVPLLQQLGRHDLENLAANGLHDLRDNSIAELLVGLGVGDDNFQTVIEALEPQTFARRQATRVLSCALGYENFRSVFEVARRERARHAIACREAKTKPVPLFLVALG